MASAVLETSRTYTDQQSGVSRPHGSEARQAAAESAAGGPVSRAGAVDHRTGKYLTFLLGREEFAIQVLKVREIMGIQDITAVPQTPDYVKGVINLRGKVIPVVDLRLKFALPEIGYAQRTCIIVVQVQSSGTAILTGIIVDEVSEVLNLAAADIEDTPDFGGSPAPGSSYLLGMAKIKGKVKILLDIDRVLSSQEVHGLGAIAQF
ncbi:MAG TPA: chemotaxis protein CheW [Terracidiphilus sp.]|nr:chemotaxis protein CheW [Terracidiphilus sp.]